MAPAQEKADSVYDFLYIDSLRVAHFLSQFNQYGHLTSLTRSRTEAAKASGGFDVKVAKMDGAEEESTTLQRQFDPQWIAPLSFLDQASQRGMIVRGLSGARMGQLVLASGELTVLDFGLLKKAWELPFVKQAISGGVKQSGPHLNRAERHRRDRETTKTSEPNPQELGMQMMTIMPHAVQAYVGNDNSGVWCSLKEDCLVVSSSDLFLKHGVTVSGDWQMLGILDALPEATKGDYDTRLKEAADKVPQGMAMTVEIINSGLGAFIKSIAPVARMLLGRPTGAYGMTPILIFREVSGPDQS